MNKLLILTRQAGLGRVEERHPLDSVEAFYAEDKYTLVRLTDGADTFVMGLIDKNGITTTSSDKGRYLSINGIEQWLEAHGATQFLRSHRAWIANMNHVKTYRAPEAVGKGGTLTTYSQATIPSSRRMAKTTKWAWRNGMGATAAVLLAIGLLTAAPDGNAADKPKLPPPTEFVRVSPKPPVIIHKQCSSTGCWLHFSDGTSQFVAGAK
ncbi:LytTR family DNA-binding domain-containing protein [Thiothrix lacustris]|uniref:LytTR family DNA-binding domain-containing protein n=1 Tax=Thiothrix lacustris TaxID=525917 RepID=UPI00049212D0|nr:LytTR family DNA-binding domain-containing protein [Thiothrix lacustris]